MSAPPPPGGAGSGLAGIRAGSTLDTSTGKVAGAGLGDDFNALFETFDKS